MNIFIIEDNEQNMYLFRFILETAGHTVNSAMDGASGIDRLCDEPPDILLLDIQLPDMDGYQVAATLRRNRAFDHVPIVAITSYAMTEDRLHALESGFDAYIEKPINVKTFAAEISEIARGDYRHHRTDR